jgi:phosphate transport system permease protein
MSEGNQVLGDGTTTAPGRSGPLGHSYVQVRSTRPLSLADVDVVRARADEAATEFSRLQKRRKRVNTIMLGLASVSSLLAIIPLVAIALFVLIQGISSLNLDFFTHAESEVDSFGIPLGIGNTIVGTVLIVIVACLIGLPIGLFSGIYLAEYGRGRFADTVRFLADVMAGIPSIIAGLVGYALVVVTFGFSAIAGGVALGLLMFPVVTRATEEVLRLVPLSLREGGLALGVPRWRVIASIVVPAAANGIVTSMLLGVARVTGETAPLLFTAFTHPYWEWDPAHPVSALTVTIFNYVNDPDPTKHKMAFAGALVLVAFVVALNLAARLIFRQRLAGRT